MKKLDFSKTSRLIQNLKKSKIDSKNILKHYNYIFNHFLIDQK